MARSDVELSDQKPIERYIERHPFKAGVAEARLKGYGVSVWALVGSLPATRHDLAQLAADYDVPLAAVEAAMVYYRRHAAFIDARPDANAPDEP